MIKPKVIIRADGNSEIGMGHITRSLALAEMIQEHFDCFLATRFANESIKKVALNVCQEVIELDQVDHEQQFLKYLHGNEIVVLDNYFYDYRFQQSICNNGNPVVIIDDLHDKNFHADAIINHAPLVDKHVYSALPETKFYLGLDYALLRKPFLQLSNSTRGIQEIKSVFLCFGGSDINDFTGRIFDALINISQIENINVVIGGAYTHQSILKKKIEVSKHPNTTIFHGLGAEEMIRVMSSSDMGIVPASSILFEVLKVGMPVLSGYYTENQLDIYNGFVDLDVINGVGDLRNDLDFLNLIREYLGMVKVPLILSRQKELFKSNSASNILDIFHALNYESSNFS